MLLVAAMEGDAELIKEMKSIRKGKKAATSELPDSVGGAVGEDNIAELFRTSYEELYNSRLVVEWSSNSSAPQQVFNSHHLNVRDNY